MRTFCLIATCCVCLAACQPQDSDGERWSVDAATDAADATDSATTDTAPDAADTTPEADAAADADASDPDYPSFFIECQPADEGPGAEEPYRKYAPRTYTLEEAWSASPQVEHFDEVFESTALSAPSLRAPGSNGRPEVRVTAQTLEDEIKAANWYAYTDNGEVRGSGSTSATDDLFRSTAAAPTTRDTRGVAEAIGMADSEGGPLESLQLDWRFSINDGTYSYGFEVSDLPDNPDRVIGRLGLFPRGRSVVRWGHRWLVGLNPEYFRAEEGFFRGNARLWWASGSDLWPGADQPRIRWIAGPRPEQVVALVESESGEQRWVEVDRCGVSREVYTAGALTRDILWTGDDYLLMRDDDAHPGGATPVRALGGDIVAEGDIGCRDLVERRPDEWTCLRQSQTGFQAVTFGRDLEPIERSPIPDEGVSWSRARLHVAGEAGALVFAGTVFVDGELKYGVATRTEHGSGVTVIEPEPGDDPASTSNGIRSGILSPDGVFAFSTSEAVYAVQTDIRGLANTRHPRVIYAGNDARGYVEP